MPRPGWVQFAVVAGVLVFFSKVPVSAGQTPAQGETAQIATSLSGIGAIVPASLFEQQKSAPPLAIPPASRGFSGVVTRRSLLISYVALQALDAHSTLKALDAGGRELNPLMLPFADNHAALVAVKAGTAAATGYVIEKVGKRHPKRAVVLLVALNAFYAGVVAHNYRVAREQR